MEMNRSERHPASPRTRELRAQRDLAAACAGLSLIVSLAIFLSIYADRNGPLPSIRREIALHEQLLAAQIQALKANQVALTEAQFGLAALQKAKDSRSP